MSDDYKFDEFTKSRNNEDIHTNTFGEKLIDLAVSTMRILNGQTLGDFLGKFTYIGYNGVSLVDYVLASEKLHSLIHCQRFNRVKWSQTTWTELKIHPKYHT